MVMDNLQKLKSICEVKGIKLLRPLGDGAQGVIYHGYRTKTYEQYAIKVQDLSSSNRLNQFQNELEIMASLQDDHTVSLKQSFLYEKNAFIVMEKMDSDLMDYILNQGRISEDEARNLFHKICVAVQSIHKKNIAHVDLKPENVLLNFPKKMGGDITVKLCDFGHGVNYSAQFKQSSDKKNVRVLNKFFKRGTQQYRAPELVNESLINLEKTDVWSLGIILFVMLTGFFPQVLVPKSSLDPAEDYRNIQYFISEDVENITVLNIDLLKSYASNECFEFLEMLLKEDPTERLSLDEIVKAAWFNQSEVEICSPRLIEEDDNCEDITLATAASNPSLTATR